jgi:hypothetical protein
MALPDSFKVSQGTAIIWGEAGASGVTHTLSLDALADGAARQGASADLGAGGADWDREYLVYLVAETGTAPTAGNVVDLYLVSSQNGTDWPAKVTGSDAAYTLGTADANLRQAGAPVVSLFATNDANTVLRQAPVVWRPAGRYVAPIVDNNLGQAIRDEATATNNDSRVILIPLVDKVID